MKALEQSIKTSEQWMTTRQQWKKNIEKLKKTIEKWKNTMQQPKKTIEQLKNTMEQLKKYHGKIEKTRDKSMNIMEKSMKTMDKSKNTMEKIMKPVDKLMIMRDCSYKMQQMNNFSCKNQGREPGRLKNKKSKKNNLIPRPTKSGQIVATSGCSSRANPPKIVPVSCGRVCYNLPSVMLKVYKNRRILGFLWRNPSVVWHLPSNDSNSSHHPSLVNYSLGYCCALVFHVSLWAVAGG